MDKDLNLKKKLTITTLVQFRNKSLGMIFLNNLSKEGKGIFDPKYSRCVRFLENYYDDLRIKSGDKSWDIMKIKFPGDQNYLLVQKLFENNINPDKIVWDWSREESIKEKEVSVDEINNILKEKYPDIEKFNIKL